jgi:hypothetical protein
VDDISGTQGVSTVQSIKMRKNSRLKSNETVRWERRSLKTADPKFDDGKHSISRFKTGREYAA